MKTIPRTHSTEVKSGSPRALPSRGDARPRILGPLRFGVVPLLFAFLALAGFTFADIPITGSITGNSTSYTISFGPANAGSTCLVTVQNATTNQSVATNHTANQSGQVIGAAFLSGGIAGGDTVHVTVYQPNPMGELEVVATASFTKPKPPFVLRLARALQRAVQELLG